MDQGTRRKAQKSADIAQEEKQTENNGKKQGCENGNPEQWEEKTSSAAGKALWTKGQKGTMSNARDNQDAASSLLLDA